jgi:hypothetical protein
LKTLIYFYRKLDQRMECTSTTRITMRIGVEMSFIQKKLRTILALYIGVKFAKLTNLFYKVVALMFTQVEQSTKVIFLIPNLLEKADRYKQMEHFM